MELSSVNRVDPSCSHPINNELNYFRFLQDNLAHPSDAEDTYLSSDHHQKKEDLVASSLFCTFHVKTAVQATCKSARSHMMDQLGLQRIIPLILLVSAYPCII